MSSLPEFYKDIILILINIIFNINYIKLIHYFNIKGPSPDEVTLVDTARHYGYVFLGGT